TDNPDVQHEIFEILKFWILLGIDGIRIDAAGEMFFNSESHVEPALREAREDFMQELRTLLTTKKSETVLIAEANVDREVVPAYFTGGARFHMLFNFLTNGAQYVALVKKSAAPLIESLSLQPRPAAGACWINFLRNFDELNLGRLSKEDLAQVYAALAPDP